MHSCSVEIAAIRQNGDLLTLLSPEVAVASLSLLFNEQMVLLIRHYASFFNHVKFETFLQSFVEGINGRKYGFARFCS